MRRAPRTQAGLRAAASSGTTSTVRVVALSLAMVAAATTLYVVRVRHMPAGPAPFGCPWWVLTLGFAASEIFVIHLQFRRDAHSISLSEVPIIVGLLFASPTVLIVSHLVGAGVTLVVHRRQPLLKLIFNLSKFTIEPCVALLAFRPVLGHSEALGPRR